MVACIKLLTVSCREESVLEKFMRSNPQNLMMALVEERGRQM